MDAAVRNLLKSGLLHLRVCSLAIVVHLALLNKMHAWLPAQCVFSVFMNEQFGGGGLQYVWVC